MSIGSADRNEIIDHLEQALPEITWARGFLMDEMVVDRNEEVFASVLPATDATPPGLNSEERELLIQIRPSITTHSIASVDDLIDAGLIEDLVKQILVALKEIENGTAYWFLAPRRVQYLNGMWADLYIGLHRDSSFRPTT